MQLFLPLTFHSTALRYVCWAKKASYEEWKPWLWRERDSCSKQIRFSSAPLVISLNAPSGDGMSFDETIFWIEINLRRSASKSGQSRRAHLESQKEKHQHRYNVRNWHNKSCSYSTLGSRWKCIRRPAPTKGFGKVTSLVTSFNTHHEGKETVQSSDNQEKRKICSTHTPLDTGSQYEISDERYEAWDDNVVSSLSSLVAMPSLQDN